MENETNRTNNQLLIQYINEAAVYTDISFIIKACNKAAATLFNNRLHDIAGFDISSLTPSSETNNQALSLKSPAFTQGIMEYVNSEGKKTQVHISRHSIDAESINGGFLFIYKQVDQNNQIGALSATSNGLYVEPAVSALLHSEEGNHCPVEPYSQAIFIFNKKFHCLDANINACHLTGYTRHELTNLNLKDLLHFDELNQQLPEKAALEAGEKILWEKKMKAKDGSTYFAECTLQQMCDDRILFFMHDVTKLKKTELEKLEAIREFRKTTTQLRELSDYLLNIRETERKNIAREIHDELGQHLTILKMDISWLHQKLQKYEDATVLQKTSDTLQLLNETIKTVRRIATELRPSMLDDLGLIEAMEWQSKEFQNRSGIKINFKSTISHLPVANSVATSLFRIYQEALTNICRHAKAKNVYSKMHLDNDKIILTIQDDGIGIDMKTLGTKKTLGLLGMKERTIMMGGHFEINSEAGKGTTIVITTSLQLNGTAKSQTDQ